MAEAHLRAARRSLMRQSLLIGVVAAAVDVGLFAASGIFAVAPGTGSLLAVMLIAVDLALAAPPRSIPVVAVAQVVTRLLVCWQLSRYDVAAGIGDLGILVAGYRAGAWLSDRAALFVVPVLVAGVSGAAIINSASRTWWMMLLIGLSNAIVPWLVGRYTAAGGAYITELELRQQRHHAAWERTLVDEREAIARDLHDVISHHVSAIGIHAGAARMALDTDLRAAHRSLSAVETSSRAAMADLRRQLDLLYGRADAGDRQPGLANIAELINTVGQAGLRVEADVPDDAVLPPSLDVTVYRIVQELLTNALRYGAGSAQLRVCLRPGRVDVEESNLIAKEPYSGEQSGRGLDGIRRRAELFDGTVDYDADDPTLWRITVSLPIAAS